MSKKGREEKIYLSYDELDLVWASDIRQYHFCPRIIYFTKVLGVQERTTESEKKGKESHKEFHRKEARRSTLLGGKRLKVKKRWTGLYLASRKLRLHGVVDLVAETDKGFIVVEFKEAKCPRNPPEGHVYQAAAYAMLVEEHFNTIVRTVLIYYAEDKRFHEISMSDALRKHVRWTISKIRKIMEEERLPPVRETRKCPSCGYLWICKAA